MLPSRTRVLHCLLAAALVSSLLPVAAEAAVPRTAYGTNFGSDNLSPINVFSGTVDPVIAVGGLPRGIAITPDGTTAYVANSMSDTVTPVDTVTGTVSPAIPVGTTPEAIAITPDGATAYVTNANSGEVIPIDVATNMAGTPIGGLATPRAIAITPDGATAYVATESSHSVVPIDTATNTAGPPIAVGLTPRGITITPDGATAYVANAFDNAVAPIDTATDTPGLPIPVGNFPVGIAITPDGARAYVTNADTNSVTVIDTSSNTAGTTIPVGATPIGIAITPDQAPQAAFGATPAMAGSASSFDASASTDEDGTVASYVWDFGDGHSDTTGAPAASHTYAAPGTYTVTLTVTDNEGCSTQFVFTGQTASCNGTGVARVQHDVTVPAAAKPEPPADPVPPAAPSPPAAPPSPVGAEAAQTIERFDLASRCVRPSRAGLVRVGLHLRLVRRGPVRVQVQRAVGSGAMKSCPTPSRSRSFDGRLRGVELRRSIEPRVAAAAVSGRMTLRVRLRPGLYRITVRAYGPDAGLTQPARRWLR